MANVSQMASHIDASPGTSEHPRDWSGIRSTQQQQRTPAFRPHHHHHSHHQNPVSLRSPIQSPPQPQRQRSSYNAHTSTHSSRSGGGVIRRSPPSYSDFMLTPTSAAGSTSSAGALMAHGGEGGGQPITSSSSLVSSPQLRLQGPEHGRYRSSLPVPPPLRSLHTPTTPQNSTTIAAITAASSAQDVHSPAQSSPFHQKQRQQHWRYAEPSRRPEPRATLRRHLPPTPSTPAMARQDSRSPSRCSNTNSTSLDTQQHGQYCYHNNSTYATVVVHDAGYEEVDGLATPVDQRIPAIMPPSFDAYNLGGGAAAATRGNGSRAATEIMGFENGLYCRHPRQSSNAQDVSSASSAVSRGVAGSVGEAATRKALHPTVAITWTTVPRHTARRGRAGGPVSDHRDYSSSHMLTPPPPLPTQAEGTAQNQGNQVDTMSTLRSTDAMTGTPPHHSTAREIRATAASQGMSIGMGKREGDDQRSVDDSTSCSGACECACGFDSPHWYARQPTDAGEGADEFTKHPSHGCHEHQQSQPQPHLSGVSCGGVSPSFSEWRSPSSGANAGWHHVASSIDASALCCSGGSGGSSGSNSNEDLDNAALLSASMPLPPSASSITPLVTPARAAIAAMMMTTMTTTTTATPTSQTAAAQELHLTTAEDVSVLHYGQCSTPRELCLPLSTAYSSPTTAAVAVVATQQQQQWFSATPTTVAVSQSTAASVPTQNQSTSTVAAAAATGDAGGVPSIFLSPSLADAATVAAATPAAAVPSIDRRRQCAHLHYLRNADFLFAVDDEEEDDEVAERSADPLAAAAASRLTRTPVAPTATATAIAVAPTSILRSPSDASSSTYCSPQLLRGHDHVPVQELLSSAAATPAAAARSHGPAYRSLPRHHNNRHVDNTTSTTTTTTNNNSGSHSNSMTVASAALTNSSDALFASPSHMYNFSAAAAQVGSRAGGDGWRSPLQWNPRQARDDFEMLEAKEVAQYAVAHYRNSTARAHSVATPSTKSKVGEHVWESTGLTQRTSPLEASLLWSVDAARTSPTGARSCAFPRCDDEVYRLNCSRAFSTGDVGALAGAKGAASDVLDGKASAEMKEEAEAEWIELLLHYRDRENESSRIRHALENASATNARNNNDNINNATAPTAELVAGATPATGVNGPAASVTAAAAGDDDNGAAAASLSWWATSSLMRGGFAVARRQSTAEQQQHERPAQRAVVSRTLPPPPTLCAAMMAHAASRTIARQVRRQLRQRRDADRRNKFASLATRMPRFASRREDSLR